MDFDFNLILVPATLVFFVIWLLDKLVWKQRATRGKGNENTAIAWAYDFWPVLAVVLVVRSFIVEPFNIPSESMLPTLETGDFILVDKSAYGVRLPLVHTRIFGDGTPERGDVAVFRYPPQPSINYIKRVIGIAGDTVRFENNQLSVNGQLVQTVKLSEADIAAIAGLNQHTSTTLIDGQTVAAEFYRQQLGERSFLWRDLVDFEPPLIPEQGWEMVVPADSYFVMGDNRDQSADSRFWGVVPDANLSGRAFYIWMHKDKGWFKLPTFSRNQSIQ